MDVAQADPVLALTAIAQRQSGTRLQAKKGRARIKQDTIENDPNSLSKREEKEYLMEVNGRIDMMDSGALNFTNNEIGEMLSCVATFGDVSTLKRLVNLGADINFRFAEGYTPLHCAASRGNIEAAIALLEAGANVDAKNKGGSSSLYEAAALGETSMIKLLIDNGADVDCSNKDRFSPLLSSAKNGHFAAAMALLDAGANVNHQDKNGWTALQYALSESLVRGVFEQAGVFLESLPFVGSGFNMAQYDMSLNSRKSENMKVALRSLSLAAGQTSICGTMVSFGGCKEVSPRWRDVRTTSRGSFWLLQEFTTTLKRASHSIVSYRIYPY